MADRIVYVLINKPGGIDGSDFNDKGGEMMGAYLERKDAEDNPNANWCTIKAKVYDLEKIMDDTIRKMNPLQRLALKIKGIK